MTAKQFNKEVENIYKKFNVKNDEVDTVFGKLYVKVEKTPYEEFYSLFMRFKEQFDLNRFFEFFGAHQTINKHSRKWNIHSSNVEYILSELEERLDNLQHLLQKHGKLTLESV
ncbi:MAG: hypothetical protein CMH22_05940 [Methylophaga sp.]|nr:hypothetical protein [Methylophaga sp.]